MLPNNLIDSLLVYGPLGIFDALLIIAVVFLYRENKTLQGKRIEDAKQITNTLTEPLHQINTMMGASNTALSSIVEQLKNVMSVLQSLDGRVK